MFSVIKNIDFTIKSSTLCPFSCFKLQLCQFSCKSVESFGRESITNRQTERQTERQTDKKTDRQTHFRIYYIIKDFKLQLYQFSCKSVEPFGCGSITNRQTDRHTFEFILLLRILLFLCGSRDIGLKIKLLSLSRIVESMGIPMLII